MYSLWKAVHMQEGLDSHNKLIHNKSIDLESDVTCEKCKKTFCNKSSKDRHVKFVHPNIDKSFKCDMCPIVFRRSDSYGKHVKVVHQQVKDYQCSQCEFAAANITCLNTNIKEFEKIPSLSQNITHTAIEKELDQSESSTGQDFNHPTRSRVENKTSVPIAEAVDISKSSANNIDLKLESKISDGHLAQKQQSQKHNVMQSTMIFNEMKKQIKPAHIKDAARKSNAEKDDMPRRNNTTKEPLPPIMRERQLENEAPNRFYDEQYVPQRRENSNLFRDTFSKLDALFSKSSEINRNLDRISEPKFNRNPPIHTMRPSNDREMEIERMERGEPEFDRNQPVHPMRPPPDVNYNRVPEIRHDEHRDADFKIIRPNHSVRSPTDAQVNRKTELIKEEYREPDFKRRQSNYPIRPPIDAMFNRELEIKQEELREEALNRDQPVHTMRRLTDTRFDRVTEIKMEECREPDLNRNFSNHPIRPPVDAIRNAVIETKERLSGASTKDKEHNPTNPDDSKELISPIVPYEEDNHPIYLPNTCGQSQKASIPETSKSSSHDSCIFMYYMYFDFFKSAVRLYKPGNQVPEAL